MRLFAREAYLPGGWAPDVAIDVAPDGTIARVDAGARADAADLMVEGPVLPGMPNVHSHAFQRAMAGRAERRTRDDDDFWSWREAMVALAATLDPDGLRAIALETYRAMLRAGYTRVAEFHYLHRDPDGRWYGDRAAMARALVDAAREAGIAICLLPALYAHGEAGGAPLDHARRRFASEPDDVLAIGADLRRAYADDREVTIGACAHSLRAVTPDELRALVDGAPPGVPMHLHAAEQLREVDAVQAALGARPVAWLLANHAIGPRWCLVHATHLDESERDALALSGATAGLCPTTEANLGDGVFPLAPYLAAGGSIGIGSDSNVSISITEELRWLEYGQRLVHRRRVVAAPPGASTGETLLSRALAGGALACGARAGAIEAGARADLVVLDGAFAGRPEDRIDRWIFASDAPAVRATAVGGRWVFGDP